MKLYVRDEQLKKQILLAYKDFDCECKNDIIIFEVNTSNLKFINKIVKVGQNEHAICLVKKKYAMYLFDLLDSESISLILQEELDEQLPAAILSACISGRFLSNYFSKIIVFKYYNEDFSKRELHIVEHIVRGLTYEQISKETHLSYGTIRNYVSRILSKYDMSSKIQLALYFQDILSAPASDIFDE